MHTNPPKTYNTPLPPPGRLFYELLTLATMPVRLTKVNKYIAINSFSNDYNSTISPTVKPQRPLVNKIHLRLMTYDSRLKTLILAL